MLGYYFVLPFQVKKADAVFGIADITFNTVVVDIPEKIIQLGEKLLKAGLRKLKNRLMAQMQNDLVNYVQGGGRPRFITDTKKFLRGAADTAAVTALDEVFGTGPNAIDVCSPFRMNVELLVRKIAIPEAQDADARCTLGEIKDNLVKFGEDFTSYGGWNSWLELHEAENTLPGAYWGVYSKISSNIMVAEKAATQEAISGNGFLNQKKCNEISVKAFQYRTDKGLGGIGGTRLKTLALLDAIQVSPGYGEPYFNIDLNLVDGSSNPIVKVTSQPEPIEGVVTYSFSEIFEEIPGVKEIITLPYDLNISDITSSNSLWGAECTKEESTTPGSTVSEWVSGGLKKLGLDRASESDDILSLVTAVVNAAANRAMQEGLSRVKSAVGTWSKPSTTSQKQSQNIQTQLEGQESPNAVAIQNQISDVLNRAERLERDLSRLGAKNSGTDVNPGKEEKFISRISRIPRIDYGHLATNGDDTKLTDVIHRLYGKYNDKYLILYPNGEVTGGKGSLYKNGGESKGYFFKNDTGEEAEQKGDRSNFNIEANIPSLYFANQKLNEALAWVWSGIKQEFENLSSDSTTSYNGKNQCAEVRYTLEPAIIDENDKLPFVVNGDAETGWASEDHSYVNNLIDTKDDNEKDERYLDVSSFMAYAALQSSVANSKINSYEQLAKSYEPLIENASSTIADLEEDRQFITDNMQNIIDLTSLVLDYDKAGASAALFQKTKQYNSTIGNANKTDAELEFAYNQLLLAQKATRDKWKEEQNLKASIASAETQRTREGNKLTIIKETIRRIEEELKTLPLPLCKMVPRGTEEILDPGVAQVDGVTCSRLSDERTVNYTQTGLGLFNAVTQAMNIDIESLTSELDERQNKISKLQNEVSNQLGESIKDTESQKQAGIDGGDTEWEKYYRNRTQLVYASYIRNFYHYYFVDYFCEGSGGSSPPISPGTPSPTPTSKDRESVGEQIVAGKTILPATIKIIPLGDSNTSGYGNGGTENSYRQKLSELLTTNTTTINYAGGGYGAGWKISNIKALVDNNILSANPDIALLMIGTNDMYYEVPTKTISDPDLTNSDNRYPIYENTVGEVDGVTKKLADLRQLLTTMRTKNPSMNIIVAKISSPTGGNAQILAPNLPIASVTRMFHDRIDGIVSSIGSDKITTVDMWECGTIPTMSDGLHYTKDGYQCLANKWANGIRALYSE
jgi:lysophospholipase L1-like esterase